MINIRFVLLTLIINLLHNNIAAELPKNILESIDKIYLPDTQEYFDTIKNYIRTHGLVNPAEELSKNRSQELKERLNKAALRLSNTRTMLKYGSLGSWVTLPFTMLAIKGVWSSPIIRESDNNKLLALGSLGMAQIFCALLCMLLSHGNIDEALAHIENLLQLLNGKNSADF